MVARRKIADPGNRLEFAAKLFLGLTLQTVGDLLKTKSDLHLK